MDLTEDENGCSPDLLTSTDSPDSPEWSSRGKNKKAASNYRKKSGMRSNSATKKPKKRMTKLEKINDQLEALGFPQSEETGNCARAGIYRGFIKLTGKPSDLNQEIVSDTLECGHNCDAKLKDLLEQPDYAGNDYEDGLQYATVSFEECAWGMTRMNGSMMVRIERMLLVFTVEIQDLTVGSFTTTAMIVSCFESV